MLFKEHETMLLIYLFTIYNQLFLESVPGKKDGSILPLQQTYKRHHGWRHRSTQRKQVIANIGGPSKGEHSKLCHPKINNYSSKLISTKLYLQFVYFKTIFERSLCYRSQLSLLWDPRQRYLHLWDVNELVSMRASYRLFYLLRRRFKDKEKPKTLIAQKHFNLIHIIENI